MVKRRHVVVLLAAAALAGCDGRRAAAERWDAEGEAMGSTWRLVMLGHAGRKEECRRMVDSVLEENERIFSTWRPDSELCRINRGLLEVGEASASFREVLALAVSVREASGGAFDERLGRIVRAAGFGPALPEGGPEGAADRPELDLSAIAKGFAVDEVCRRLRETDCDNFVFELGGEIGAVGGGADGDGWRVGVEAPDPGGRAIATVVPLLNESMATSGNYRQFLPVEGGRMFSHLIDPASGEPVVRRPGSVTVIAGNCALADAWATALFVIGPGEEAERMARENGLRVMWDGGGE